MEIEYLFHGSPFELIKGELLPREEAYKLIKSITSRGIENLGEDPNLNHNVIYASEIRDLAIAHAIISSDGVFRSSRTSYEEPYGIIYEGYPKQKVAYLHILSPENFQKREKQWISFDSVEPFKTEELRIEDYRHLFRHANPEETAKWLKEFDLEPNPLNL